MKAFGKHAAVLVVVALFWLLAFSHPFFFLLAREEARRASPTSNAAEQYVSRLEGSKALGRELKDQASIGYVSEAPIDVRVGGALQARYYLAQFALAPVLLELEGSPEGPAGAHHLVLGSFQQPAELSAHLTRTSREIVVSVSERAALIREREAR